MESSLAASDSSLPLLPPPPPPSSFVSSQVDSPIAYIESADELQCLLRVCVCVYDRVQNITIMSRCSSNTCPAWVVAVTIYVFVERVLLPIKG